MKKLFETAQEMEAVKREFPDLEDVKVRMVIDEVKSLREKP
ncbi:MAG TPA: hypothetical protein VK658_00765 [Chryseolinea sp.]|nr:hypothetical protein [Chryseolinea sp.]